MSKRCQVTGKVPVKGRKYSIRGIAKKKKGIGLNITGKTNRRFLPNLQKKRFWYSEENRYVSLKLSSAAIRTIDKLGIDQVIRDMRTRGEKV
jgi:large subunit ribosomal protein L28